MKLVFTSVLLFCFFVSSAQNNQWEKVYISNTVSIGLGIPSGDYKIQNYLRQNRTLKKSNIHIAPEYQINIGFILNPQTEKNWKSALETGLLFGSNNGNLTTVANSERLYFSQAYWGLPLQFKRFCRSNKTITQYGAGTAVIGNFFKNVATNKNEFEQSDWSFFSDGRIRVNAGGAIYFKSKKNRHWGFGLEATQDLNGTSQSESKIPFTLRATRIAVTFYPFLRFF